MVNFQIVMEFANNVIIRHVTEHVMALILINVMFVQVDMLNYLLLLPHVFAKIEWKQLFMKLEYVFGGVVMVISFKTKYAKLALIKHVFKVAEVLQFMIVNGVV